MEPFSTTSVPDPLSVPMFNVPAELYSTPLSTTVVAVAPSVIKVAPELTTNAAEPETALLRSSAPVLTRIVPPAPTRGPLTMPKACKVPDTIRPPVDSVPPSMRSRPASVNGLVVVKPRALNSWSAPVLAIVSNSLEIDSNVPLLKPRMSDALPSRTNVAALVTMRLMDPTAMPRMLNAVPKPWEI